MTAVLKFLKAEAAGGLLIALAAAAAILVANSPLAASYNAWLKTPLVLAALALLAPRADPRLRLFLLTLAVADDLIAIVLIAVLFTAELAYVPLFSALALLGLVYGLGRLRPLPMWIYPAVAVITWGLSKESGVHTSVMAMAAAFIVPPRPIGSDDTLFGQLEHYIHPFSAYVVLLIFAFSAAGVSAGVALGLAIGVGCLCGIGFTMSLFIGGLAFDGDASGEAQARLGVLMGSTLSLFLGLAAFRLFPPARH